MENHLIKLFNNRVHKNGTKEVLRYMGQDGVYKSMNWVQLKEKVENVLSSLQCLGSKKGEKIGIFSPNKAEWLMADLGILANGGVVVPFYATSSREQLKYIIEETQMRILFVGHQQLETARTLFDELPTLQHLIVFDGQEEEDRRVLQLEQFLHLATEQGVSVSLKDQEGMYDSQDLATIIYTSGTTGEPKGVMLKHDNFLYCFQIHDDRLNVSSDDVSLCFLPLSHVFERLWTHYLLHRSAVNVFLENPREVIEVMPKVKPSLMCTVPRFFDKTYQGIQLEVAKWPLLKQKIFHWAVATGHKAIEYRCRSKRLPFALSINMVIAETLVLKKLRGIFGGRIKSMPCSGAAINTDVLKFFHAVGIFVNYGYGATETTATVSCFKTTEYFFGTCGSIMPGVEVKIGENSEILVKGRSIFSGYYNKEDATAQVIKEGWFHTGDEGYMDDRGNLIMIDRIKDLMKTSVGKYVSPQKLELMLGQDEMVEQIIVVGDNRQYVTALVVPAMDKLKELATHHQIKYANEGELVDAQEVMNLIAERFAEIQKNLTPYERVVRFTLLPQPFSIEEGTMTSTLKLRRRSIEKNYKNLIDALYE